MAGGDMHKAVGTAELSVPSSPLKEGFEREGETFRPGPRRQNAGNVVHFRVLATKSLGETAAVAPNAFFDGP